VNAAQVQRFQVEPQGLAADDMARARSRPASSEEQLCELGRRMVDCDAEKKFAVAFEDPRSGRLALRVTSAQPRRLRFPIRGDHEISQRGVNMARRENAAGFASGSGGALSDG